MQIRGGCREARLFGTSIPYFQSPIPFLFIFLRTLLRFFALTKNSTLLFSSFSALFAQKHPGVGGGYTFGKISGGSQRRTMPRRIPRAPASARLPPPSLPRIQAT